MAAPVKPSVIPIKEFTLNNWINIEFFKNINLIFKKKLVTPDLYIKDLRNLDITLLKQKNIKGCAIDINQTIVAYDEDFIHDFIIEVVAKLKTNFNICAISNYIGTSTDERSKFRKELVEKILEIPVLTIPIKKPKQDIFNIIIEYFKVPSSNCAFIGDRIFTDVIGANMAGMFTILVDPINIKNDPIYVSIPRKIEKFVSKLYRIF